MKLLSRLFGSPSTYQLRLASMPPMAQLSHREVYRLLESYYLNNGLYDVLAQALYENGTWKEALKGLRNPAYRTVEFYPATVWPGSLEKLPVRADNERIIEPLKQVWHWSGWGANKQLGIRQLATYGDMVIKVVRVQEQVYFQLIEPLHVSQIDHDVRGNVTHIRVDIPVSRRRGDEIEMRYHTEIWDKSTTTFRAWEHEHGAAANEGQMGRPVASMSLAEFGIDFVPFVHAKFKDIGEARGVGSFTLAIDKIDEVNRKATRLSQMIFRHNKPLWALRANAMDATGRPLPAPRVGTSSGSGQDGDTINLGDDRMLRLPGESELQGLVPNVNYQAHLDALRADLDELEADLPELGYYRLRDTGNLSGRALQLLLAPAIDRALEVRGNAETALARADEMALSMLQAGGLWRNIGSYEAGDFRHSFAERDVFELSDLERAEETKLYVDMGVPLKTALRRQGWSQAALDQLDEDLADQHASQQQTLASAVLNAQRAVEGGQASTGMEGMPNQQ